MQRAQLANGAALRLARSATGADCCLKQAVLARAPPSSEGVAALNEDATQPKGTDGLQRSRLAACACGVKRRRPQRLRPGDLDVPPASTEEIQLSSSIAVLDVDF